MFLLEQIVKTFYFNCMHSSCVKFVFHTHIAQDAFALQTFAALSQRRRVQCVQSWYFITCLVFVELCFFCWLLFVYVKNKSFRVLS
jgi:hypothetical protein